LISIFDAGGKLVKEYEDNYEIGYNELRLDRKDLNVSGVAYYQIEVGTFKSMKKMIILD